MLHQNKIAFKQIKFYKTESRSDMTIDMTRLERAHLSPLSFMSIHERLTSLANLAALGSCAINFIYYIGINNGVLDISFNFAYIDATRLVLLLVTLIKLSP